MDDVNLPWPPDHTWPLEALYRAANHPHDFEANCEAQAELERRGYSEDNVYRFVTWGDA